MFLKKSTFSALRIALFYLVLGALWILFSDRIVESWVEDAALLSRVQTIKGWGYVALTAWLLYLLIRASIEQITRLSYHSHLTGLPNRQALDEFLETRLHEYRRGNENLSMMLLDLDDFQSVNDSAGADARRFVVVTGCFDAKMSSSGSSISALVSELILLRPCSICGGRSEATVLASSSGCAGGAGSFRGSSKLFEVSSGRRGDAARGWTSTVAPLSCASSSASTISLRMNAVGLSMKLMAHSDFLCSERYVDFCLRSALKRCVSCSFTAERSAGIRTVLCYALAPLLCRVSEAQGVLRVGLFSAAALRQNLRGCRTRPNPTLSTRPLPKATPFEQAWALNADQ